MADYNKLTVVKLKEELKNRGLPQTGLKAVLVARLTEADTPGTPSAEDDDNTRQEDAKEELSKGDDGPGEGHDTAAQDSTGTRGEGLDIAKDGAESPKVEELLSEQLNGEVGPAERASVEKASRNNLPSEDRTANENAPEAPQAEDVPMTSPEIVEDTVMSSIPQSSLETQPTDWESRTELETSQQLSMAGAEPPEAEAPAISTQTSINKEEILEDTRKRKRRSQSPPPSLIEGALKKAKALDGSPRVRLPEDALDEKADNTPVIEASNQGPISPDEDSVANVKDEGQQLSPEVQLPPKQMGVDVTQNHQPQQDNGADDYSMVDVAKQSPELVGAEAVLPPAKISPTDTRFKNLFSAPPKHNGTPPNQDTYIDMEDRNVPPAMHPATSGLYIRNFMRPLNSTSLKDHLAALARAGHSSPSEETIHDFFLDTIRTHCLVRFSNVSAASRVRSALHDRVWPDERIRKPLWVDFIPEEKIAKWIEVEQGPANARGQPVKRWEVVYEHEGGGMTAYLQEADQAGGAMRGGVNATTRDEGGRGVQGAPSGPRGSDSRRTAPRADGGKGFKALDDLFQSTLAKPKLYFLPVPKSVADRRTERLTAGRGGGRSDEMRKYTFVEDILVDRGPEFGYGRGGQRGRGGGFAPSNFDRSGGQRGDNWRGRR